MIGKLNMTPEEAGCKLFYRYKNILPTRCNVFHFFNTINYTNKPWIINIESGLPWTIEIARCVESKEGDLDRIKGNKDIEKALKQLAKPNCLALMALSECTRNIQLEILKQFPTYKDIIERKLITLHPSQELIISKLEDKGIDYNDNELTFIYVGRDYFRKGGRETVEVLAELHKDFNFRLILISDLRIDEPRYLRTPYEREEAKRIIQENSSWIEHYDFLPNEQVIEKIKRSHVAFLPTWMDTYGYSVLECQACGTPVITTSLRALTETNNENIGWLIKVPVNRLNHPIHNTREEQDEFYTQLSLGLKECVKEILKNPNQIKKKAESGIENIQKKHSPTEYNRIIKLLYQGEINTIRR
jgi:glycosyltransferase involved in cell wall biosynthesis